ncbi:MAG: hypothetical protein FJ033_12375 [Chloroflexi bacterium]|nr:hypothetical protein [Chloroflexota bacterium]
MHAADARIDAVRRQIFLVRSGIEPSDDPDARLAELDREFVSLSDAFVILYRRWAALHGKE